MGVVALVHVCVRVDTSVRVCAHVLARTPCAYECRKTFVRSQCVCEARPIRKAAPGPRPHK